MKKQFWGVLTAAVLANGGTVQADPSFGFGLTYVFGGDWAVGVRVFHDDEPESAVLALGLDYKFGSQSFRPTVGAAYLDEDFYVDFSLGYDTRLQALDYGIGVGAAFETQTPASPAAPVTAGDDTATPSGDGDTGSSDGGDASDGGDSGSDGGEITPIDGDSDGGGDYSGCGAPVSVGVFPVALDC